MLLCVLGEERHGEALEESVRGAGAEERRQDVDREGAEEVEVDAGQPIGGQTCHRVGDAGALVAALGDVAGVAEAAHELSPGLCRAVLIPADLLRLVGEAEAGQRRQDEVERVLGASAVGGRIGERADDVEHLDHRTGPAVRDEQRQRVLVRRLDVDEMDLEPVDLGLELRQRVQPRLDLAPIVLVGPVAGEGVDRRRLDALRRLRDELPAGPLRRGKAAPQLGELLVANLDPELADRRCFGGDGHNGAPLGG